MGNQVPVRAAGAGSPGGKGGTELLRLCDCPLSAARHRDVESGAVLLGPVRLPWNPCCLPEVPRWFSSLGHCMRHHLCLKCLPCPAGSLSPGLHHMSCSCAGSLGWRGPQAPEPAGLDSPCWGCHRHLLPVTLTRSPSHLTILGLHFSSGKEDL